MFLLHSALVTIPNPHNSSSVYFDLCLNMWTCFEVSFFKHFTESTTTVFANLTCSPGAPPTDTSQPASSASLPEPQLCSWDHEEAAQQWNKWNQIQFGLSRNEDLFFECLNNVPYQNKSKIHLCGFQLCKKMNQMIVVLWVKAGEGTQRHHLRKPLIERGCGLQSTSLKQTQKVILYLLKP